jgi:flagellar hook-associated protein 1
MTSTFFGLETAKRGMTTQQTALYVTGQNVSNANTPGYSRQRVNFTHTEEYPPVGMNRAQIPGQMGTGVTAQSIQRVRDTFLDQQYRNQTYKLGYWSSKSDGLSQMEEVMNEPTDSGLSTTMGQFWQSIQDLSVDPEDQGARSVVLERGRAVSETFHYLNESLNTVKQDIGNQIDVSIKDINSILDKIRGINNQISQVEPNGYLPNDLYDDRDRLVDQLSSYFNIKVAPVKSSGNPSPLAEGIYNISIVNDDNTEIPLNLTGNQSSVIGIDTNGDNTQAEEVKNGGVINSVLVDGNPIDITNLSQGKLKGLIENYGYNDGTAEVGTYPNMLDNLDKLAYTFSKIFNEVHSQGFDLNGNQGGSFFTDLGGNYKGASLTIDLDSTLTSDKIAASTEQNNKGNGSNAINLANISSWDLSKPFELQGTTDPITSQNKTIDLSTLSLPFSTGTINSFYQGIIGGLGVDAQQADRMTSNTTTLQQSVDQNRQSVSSVSIDEEMINMIKYQQAYNASARNITIVDEMLDKIVNGLGTGGR